MFIPALCIVNELSRFDASSPQLQVMFHLQNYIYLYSDYLFLSSYFHLSYIFQSMSRTEYLISQNEWK